MERFCDKNFVLKSISQDFEKNCMSSGPALEVDAFKRSVQGGFRNHMKNQMHFYHLLGQYFHFRWALHEKGQYFDFGPFPNYNCEYFFFVIISLSSNVM